MRLTGRLFAIPAFLGLCWAASANSYKISILGRYHERMTVLAERCLGGGPMPVKCTVPSSKRAFTSVSYHEGKYWAVSRWSDDPTRQSTSFGVFKFLRNVGVDDCVDYIGDFNRFPGILCSGHYGAWQFLHAQASLAPGETVRSAQDEPFETTREKMLGWTEFAFQVATGTLPTSAPFCSSARRFGAAGAALAPERFPYCEGWTVGSVFGFACSNPFVSSSCSRAVSEADKRNAATGALLHMIQDSYSRSHTGRGEHLPVGPYPQAQVRCQPIQTFYRYTLEQKKAHGKADKAPTFLPECASEERMDPITASARMIWLVENGCDSSWAKNLIAEGVIDNRLPATPATVEACRATKV